VDPDLVSWVFIEADGSPGEEVQGSLDEVAQQVTGNRVIVLVPAIDVLLTKAMVPTQNRKRLATALPYVLEDQLVGDLEDLHFAVGERQADDQVACAVVSRDRMDTWMQRLREFGIQPDMLIPDVLTVPKEPHCWAVLRDEDSVLVRTGSQAGFIIELENLEPALQLAVDDAGETKPQQLQIINCNPEGEAFPDLSSLELDEISQDCQGGVLLQFVRGLNTGEAINLLQGDYSRREQLGKVWRPWWPAAAMLGGLVILQLTMTTVDHFKLKRQSEALKAQIEQIYLSTFPEAKRVVNPRVQMERKLSALRGGSGGGTGFVNLLAGSGGVFKKTNDLELRSVRYKDGKLDIDLTIKDLQTLDGLKQSLTKDAGLEVEIVSANARNNRVESRLQLRGRKS
jgi:general secretion pathway protein L